MRRLDLWFGDSLVTKLARTQTPSGRAHLVLGGFPGEPPPAQRERYAQLLGRSTFSETIHGATGEDVYWLRHPGLGGSRGRFGFRASVLQATAFVERLVAEGHRRVNIVGYSWGGFVAFNAHRNAGGAAGRLVLVAPLTDLGGDQDVRRFLLPFVEDYPNIFGAEGSGLEASVADLIATRDEFNPIALARRDGLAGEALIIHGTRDADVPVEMSRRFAEATRCRLREYGDDHVFSSGWDRMLSETASFAAG